MTATQRFIVDAIEGDWKQPRKTALAFGADAMEEVWVVEDRDELFQLEDIFVVQEALLDPLAWQAVGKTRGWKSLTGESYNDRYAWQEKWHNFIAHLADGKTIDEALSALTPNTTES